MIADLTSGIAILGLVIAAGGLYIAGKQLGTGRTQALLNEQKGRLDELAMLHATRLSTMTATIDAQQQKLTALEVQCLLNQKHAERCEAELERLRRRSHGRSLHEAEDDV